VKGAAASAAAPFSVHAAASASLARMRAEPLIRYR